MRASLEPVPLNCSVNEVCESVSYKFTILQQPKNTRESTAKKNIPGKVNAVRVYKRLLNPHPLLMLKVFGRRNGKIIDITSHVLCLFFIYVSLIDVGREISPSDGLIGTTTVSGTLFNIPKEFEENKANRNESTEGFIVFKLDDIGILEHGNYRLKISLFKYEGFHQMSASFSSPILLKTCDIMTEIFVVFKASEYYKDEIQRIIRMQTEAEFERTSSHKVLRFLKAFKLVKYASFSDSTSPKVSSKKANINVNIKPPVLLLSSPISDSQSQRKPNVLALDTKILQIPSPGQLSVSAKRTRQPDFTVHTGDEDPLSFPSGGAASAAKRQQTSATIESPSTPFDTGSQGFLLGYPSFMEAGTGKSNVNFKEKVDESSIANTNLSNTRVSQMASLPSLPGNGVSSNQFAFKYATSDFVPTDEAPFIGDTGLPRSSGNSAAGISNVVPENIFYNFSIGSPRKREVFENISEQAYPQPSVSFNSNLPHSEASNMEVESYGAHLQLPQGSALRTHTPFQEPFSNMLEMNAVPTLRISTAPIMFSPGRQEQEVANGGISPMSELSLVDMNDEFLDFGLTLNDLELTMNNYNCFTNNDHSQDNINTNNNSNIISNNGNPNPGNYSNSNV